jgi:hypothetical protein
VTVTLFTIYTQIIITNKNLESPLLAVRIEHLINFWEFPSKLTDYSAKNHQCGQPCCESPSHGSSASVALGSLDQHLAMDSIPSVEVGTLLVPRRLSPLEARSKLAPAARPSAWGCRGCTTLLWLLFRILSVLQFIDSHCCILYFPVLSYFARRCTVAVCFLV